MNTNKNFGILAAVVFAASVFVSPVSAACTLQTLGECDQAGLMSLISGLSTTPTATVTPTTTTTSFAGIPAGFTFTKNMKLGARSDEVKYLQVFLNADTATQVAATGAGSAGRETTYFGPATTAAVKKFQAKYGITPVLGNWYALTRAKANELLASNPTTPTTPTTPTDTGCLPGAAFSSTTGLPCTGTTTPTNPTVPVTGSLSVAIASDNPAASTLISGQSIADLAHFTLTNGSTAEVKITTVELTRLGISADATLKNVYLFDGATRLTDAGSVSSGKVTFNATNGVIVIPAGTVKTITVKADIDTSTSGQTVGIALSGVTSTATLAASLPLNGNIHTIANASLASVTVAATTYPHSDSGNLTTDPMNDVRVWENQLNIGTRNVVLSRIAFKQQGSIETKDIKNFRLLVDGVEVAKVDSLDSNGYVTFTLNKTLTTGNRTLKVLADVVGGSGRTFQMSLKSKADVDVKDAEYNVSITVSATATATATNVNNGNLQVTKASDSVSGKVPNNSSNVALAKYTFKAYGEPLRIETVKVKLASYTSAGANAAASLRNGKVYVNGSQVGSTATITAGGTDFTTNFIVEPGTPATVEVYADVYDNDGTGTIGNNDTMSVGLAVTSYEKRVSGGVLAVSNINGNLVTVAEGGMSVGVTSSYTNQSIVIPQTLYKVGSWDISGSSTEDINLSSLDVSIAQTVGAPGGGAADDFAAANLKDVYIKLIPSTGSTVDLSLKSTVGATGNSWSTNTVLPKNGSVKVELWARVDAGEADTDDQLQATLVVSGTGVLSGAAVNNGGGKAGQLITVNIGRMNISRAASTPVSAVVDDSGKVITASYKFEAQNDAYTIEEINVKLPATGVTAIANVSLKDGATVLATRPADTTVTFGGLNLSVPANQSKTLDIELELTSIGAGAGSTGADLSTNIQGATAVTIRSSATGISEQKNTTGVAVGNAIYAYKAIPTISLVSLPSSTLTAGTNAISKFSVSTNGTGSVAWKSIVFNLAKTSTANKISIANATSVELWDVDSNTKVTSTGGITLLSTDADGAGTDDSNNDCTALDSACTITFVADAEQLVSGQKTYELRANITVGSAGISTGDYLNTRIPSVANNKIGSNTAAAIAAADADNVADDTQAPSFVWSDMSAQGHSTDTQDWNNEYLIKNLPTATQNITK